MSRRPSFLVLLALLVLALAATGAAPVAGDGPPARQVADGLNVTTARPIPLGNGTVSFVGRASGIEENATVVVWFEYRAVRSDTDEWRRTPRQNLTGPGWFNVNVSGLDSATGYEVRARAARADATAVGDVRSVKVRPGSTPTPGSDECAAPGTTPPCPSPTSATSPVTVGQETPPAESADSTEWLAGFLPLLAWVGAVALAAPLVLGGLLWLDGRRRERS